MAPVSESIRSHPEAVRLLYRANALDGFQGPGVLLAIGYFGYPELTRRIKD